MQQRLQIFIPIVLFAALVQLFAPIGAFRAVASSASDPLAAAPICSQMARTGDMNTAPSDRSHTQGSCCAFCAVGHAMAAVIDPPAQIFVSLQRQYRRVTWLEAMDPIAIARVGSNAQARAPPLMS